MADLYSDHYNTTISSATIESPRPKTLGGVNHAAIRYKRATITVTTATAAADVLRFFQFKSGDRLHALYLSHDVDASTSAAGDLGLHTSAEGGAVKDLNLFCAVGTAPMIDITLAIDRAEVFANEVLSHEDRGKTLWESLFVGAGTDTVDPLEFWDVTMTISAEVGIVASEYVMEAYYTVTT